MIEQIAGALALKKAVLLWAIAGALLSLRFAPSITTWPGRALVVSQSLALAVIATPFAAEQLQASAASEQFIAAALALFGISLCDAVMRVIRETNFSAELSGWLKRPGDGK